MVDTATADITASTAVESAVAIAATIIKGKSRSASGSFKNGNLRISNGESKLAALEHTHCSDIFPNQVVSLTSQRV